ncbi:MAG: transcriptional repressor [Desulfobacterales bacterium]|nr:transcriptional repressor [Desulfobacterales bacterium]MDD4070963.1 transcriptional repressor [Desulfobacterales bacterium]MDD4394017.1 transcriptional repressor [Desulfobacterales bacterium]
MEQVHSREKEQFKKLFQNEVVDQIDEKYQILEVFLQSERHVTVAEMSRILNEQGYSFSIEFVRDTLKFMCRYGFARKVRFDDGLVRFEHHHLGDHHDHMVCTKCGRIVEFKDDELERLLVKVVAAHGFHMVQHKVETYGFCSDCMKQQMQLMPLTMAKKGEKVVIREFAGGSGVRMRLMTMGMRLGDIVDVITNMGNGQLVVAVDCKRYVLGQGVAGKIIVEIV